MAPLIQHIAEQKGNFIKDHGQHSDVQSCVSIKYMYIYNAKFRKQRSCFCFDISSFLVKIMSQLLTLEEQN